MADDEHSGGDDPPASDRKQIRVARAWLRAALGAPGKEPEVMALLLEEYRALRAEFGQRVAARLQLLGFAGILSAVLATAGGFRFDAQNLYVGMAVAMIGLWAWRTTNGAAQRVGRHLCDVEQRLNEHCAS
ncbi:hypothetical protein [Streptomyces sp. NPDC020951]|uniref:hypothetical protein n=1 Tax=Streptomyces sp. NPDC020951 TaxID=3365104 RepID=UPI00379ADDA2